MKIVILDDKKEFIDNAPNELKEMESIGVTFYNEAKSDLSNITELFDNDEKVFGFDEFKVKGRFQALNDAIGNFKNVKAVCGPAARFHEIDIEKFNKLGIKYCNNRGANSKSVGQHAIMLMFMLLRKYNQVQKAQFKIFENAVLGEELDGKSVGIIGMGNIGKEIATRCQQLGMEVKFYNRSMIDSKKYGQQSHKDIVLAQDIIFINIAANEDTKKLFGEDFYNSIKGRYLIDTTATDDIFDKNRVIGMVNIGDVAGFGFEMEDQNSKFIETEGNIIVTPHSAWATKQSLKRITQYWGRNLLNAARGNITNSVN